MPSTGDPLTRHYRRLLLCYPRSYRRARGEEILGLLLDTAPAGRTRPTVREAVDLVRGGLRCRLGRPASSTVVVWAVLTALICGLFSAALASRAAWETSRPQPDRAEASEIFRTIFPGHDLSEIETAPALFVVYGQPLRWQGVDDLLFGDGGEYQESAVGAGALGVPPVPQEQTLRMARQRLAENGWRLYEPVTRDAGVTCLDKQCVERIPTSVTELWALRGDTVLSMTLFSASAADATYLAVELHRATPLLVHPAAVLGGLVGAVAAWLLFGWASRRTEPPHPARQLVKVLFGVTTFLWWVPVLVATPSLIGHHLDEPHPSWHPLWEWLGQPVFLLFFVVGAGCALIGLALAALPRRDADLLPSVAAG